MLLESVSGVALKNARVHLPIEKPEWHALYYDFLGDVELDFSATELSVDVPLEYMQLPSLMADPGAFKQAEIECERLLKLQSSGGDLVQQIRNNFIDHGAPYPTLETLAAQLNMSRRTLIRKLKQQDTSYQELLDDVRKELAAWQLLNTNASIEFIAEQLGYIDTTNFSRTFRRWFNMTAREFRQSAQMGSQR